jgi:hypothetical protein
MHMFSDCEHVEESLQMETVLFHTGTFYVAESKTEIQCNAYKRTQ